MNVLRPNYDYIPTELKTRRQWVCWQLRKTESPNGKPPKKPFTKIPICPVTGKNASTVDPKTWTEFGTACTYYEAFADDGDVHGLGYILRDDLIGVDLDGCRDADTGQITEWASEIISLLNSYTEISPSGTGIRIFCKGEPRPKGSSRRKDAIEIYDCNSPRYLTITGWHVDATPDTIEERQSDLARLYGQVFGQQEEPAPLLGRQKEPVPRDGRQEEAARKSIMAPSSTLRSLDKILTAAKSAKNADKFAKLWQGDWASDYPSQSEADLALAAMLAFYTGANEELLDEVFRHSGLYRDKWDRDDYRESVLAKALDREEFYSWGVSSAVEELAKEIADNGGVAALYDSTMKKNQPQKKEKPTQTQQLIEIAETGELWRTPDYEAYVTIPIGGHWENKRLRSADFRCWLVGRYAETHNKNTPTDTAVKSALDVLEYEAKSKPVHEVYLRIARLEDRIYWDLGNEKWEAIEITAEGWRVIDRPQVKFRRTRNTDELPYPVTGGNLDELQRLLKSPDEYWVLIRGWLLDCLKGQKPYLVLVVSGEQGSAKSTLLRCLRQIIDPLRKAELSSLPRDERDLGVDGESEYCLVYDNVSYLPPWLSDALCRVSTGAGIKTRRLYSDDEQTIFGFARPLALNGIPDFAENQDLLSRSLVIQQPAICDTERQKAGEMDLAYAAMRPRLVGALCDMAVRGLREHRTIRLERLPRMADSATWITACTGDTQFLDHLLENQTVAQEIALESSHTAEFLLRWLKSKGNQWQGNCKELLDGLRSLCRDCGEFDKLAELPKTPRALSGRLKRDAPAIRSLYKIDVRVGIQGAGGKRLVVIQPVVVLPA